MSKRRNGLDQETTEKARTKLAASGLTLEDAKALGIRILTPPDTAAMGHEALPALLFQYHDLDGTPVPLPDFHRARYLSPPSEGGWGAQLARPQRYVQPAGSLNWAYLPRSMPWAEIAADPERSIVITEGELKAACACKRGIPTIGLGGVDVFRAPSRGVNTLPPLDRFVWRGRIVYVIFDTETDGGLKPTVMEATQRLMNWLVLKGATPYLVILPRKEGKVGLDDYLVAHPNMLDAEFMQEVVLPHRVEFESARKLVDGASKYCFVEDIARFFQFDESANGITPYRPEHLRQIAQMDQVVLWEPHRERIKDVGWRVTLSPTPVWIDQALLRWPGLLRAKTSVYQPGTPRLEGGNLNLWAGWRCEYEGAHPRAQLPDRAFRDQWMGEWAWAMDEVYGDDAVIRELAEHWFLYPIRHPGAKHFTMLFVWSPEEGIGKSFLPLRLARHVYGLVPPGPCHASIITSDNLESQFNSFLNAKSLLVVEEMEVDNRSKVFGKLKNWATGDTHEINIKGTPQFAIENHANTFASSNRELMTYMVSEDRRTIVHRPRKFTPGSEKRWAALERAFASGMMGPTLLWHARERYDAKTYDPHIRAPMTEAKAEMVDISMFSDARAVQDVVHDAARLSRTLVYAQELQALCRIDPDRRSEDSIGRYLSRHGCRRYANGEGVLLSHLNPPAKHRIWSLANHERNLALPLREVLQLMSKPLEWQVVPIAAGKTAKGRKY